MRQLTSPRFARTRAIGAAGIALVLSIAISSSIAHAQVGAALSNDTIAVVTGGGTVVVTGVPNVIASFGINGKRPAGFTGGGTAVGRINYDKHAQVAGRHVNVPVILMQAEISGTPTPNGTGGRAVLVGDCGAPQAECPQDGTTSVDVYVEDNTDAGGGGDVFRIFYCAVPPSLPGPTFNGTVPPAGCTGPEGGLIRTGNIQIRASGPSGSGGNAPTAVRAPLRRP